MERIGRIINNMDKRHPILLETISTIILIVLFIFVFITFIYSL